MNWVLIALLLLLVVYICIIWKDMRKQAFWKSKNLWTIIEGLIDYMLDKDTK